MLILKWKAELGDRGWWYGGIGWEAFIGLIIKVVSRDWENRRQDAGFGAMVIAIMGSEWELVILAPSETPSRIFLLNCLPHVNTERECMKYLVRWWQIFLMRSGLSKQLHSDDSGAKQIISVLADGTVLSWERMTRFDVWRSTWWKDSCWKVRTIRLFGDMQHMISYLVQCWWWLRLRICVKWQWWGILSCRAQ